MNQKNQIIELIKAAISSPPNELTRSFYYDKLNQTFFIIHIVDYFMLNEDLEIDNSAQVSISEKSQKEIVDWIKRIEKNDDSIIRVPQKGITDEELKHIEFLKYIKESEIDLDIAKIQKVEEGEEKVSVKFDLKKIGKTDKKWWEFWK